MDSRFTQKGKIWRDFADDDDSNDAGVADSGSEDGSDNNDGLGDYEEQEKLKTWGHNDGSEDEDWKSDEQKEVEVHVANEKKRAEDKDQKKKKEKEKKQIEKGKDKASARTAVDKNDEEKEKEEKEGEDEEEEKRASSEKRVRKSSALRKDAEQYRDKLGKRGVLYLSRVPRKMNPDQARKLLEEYGEITRIYLAEEDASAHKRRAAAGGSATRHFIEGWVEFANKSIAKRVAASLNNSPISMRKGNAYVDERWNLKVCVCVCMAWHGREVMEAVLYCIRGIVLYSLYCIRCIVFAVLYSRYCIRGIVFVVKALFPTSPGS